MMPIDLTLEDCTRCGAAARARRTSSCAYWEYRDHWRAPWVAVNTGNPILRHVCTAWDMRAGPCPRCGTEAPRNILGDWIWIGATADAVTAHICAKPAHGIVTTPASIAHSVYNAAWRDDARISRIAMHPEADTAEARAHAAFSELQQLKREYAALVTHTKDLALAVRLNAICQPYIAAIAEKYR